MQTIKGKLVLISGASEGIGAKTAEFMALKGAILILIARNKEKLINVKEIIEDKGGKAFYYSVDLSKSEQIDAVSERIKKEIGVPDIIINNAGSGQWLTIEETSDSQLQDMIALPYMAAFNLTKAFLSEMKSRGSGHVVNLTSDASFLPKAYAIAYTASRYALRGFSEALRSYLLGTGINVSLAVFGKVDSSYWHNNPGSESRVPKATAGMKTLSVSEVANDLMKLIEKNKRIIIKPGVFKTLFWAFRNWPDRVSSTMNKSIPQ